MAQYQTLHIKISSINCDHIQSSEKSLKAHILNCLKTTDSTALNGMVQKINNTWKLGIEM